jgi:hypothetical protein
LVGLAVNVIGWPAHVGLLPDVIAIAIAGATVVVMDIVIALLVAVSGLAQLLFDVITQVTTAPFVKDVLV